MKKDLINPESLGTPLGKYSNAVKVEISGASLIFCTGQIALNKSGEIVFPNDAKKQSEYIFENIATILREAGASMNNVVKATIYATDMAYFPAISEARNKYFASEPPASTFLEINRLVKEGAVVEIEVIAVA